MAVIICPECEHEMLPYLKTGELKQVINNSKLVLYQLYFCVNCKKVYYEQASEYDFIDFNKAQKAKEVEKGLVKKKKK